jgi:hypothetical protein
MHATTRHRSATARVATAAAALAIAALCAASGSRAEEIQTPEDRIVAQAVGGDLDGARRAMAELFEQRLERAGEEESLATRALQLELAARGLKVWESLEAAELAGGHTLPAAVFDKIVDHAETLHARASALERATTGTRRGADAESQSAVAAVDRAKARIADVLVHTAVLARDRAPQAKRASLLTKAGELGGAPASIAELDAANPDVVQSLGAAAPDPAVSRPRSVEKSRRLSAGGDADQATRAFMESFYRALFAGDEAALAGMFAGGLGPADAIAASADPARARRLQELGPVHVQRLGGGRKLVTLEAMRISTVDGPATLREDFLVVRRDGSLKIAAFGDDALREAGR